MEGSCRTPSCLSGQCTAVGEWYHTFGLGEAKGMWVGTVVASVFAPLAVVTILACQTVPDRVHGVDLFA